MQKTFVTSDTHFGHANIIRYCSRPFSNVADMNEGMIERWNRVVGFDDHIYHLGDFAFLQPQEIDAILGRLNGHIFLVPGNHDKQMKRLWRDWLVAAENDVRDVPPPKFDMLQPIHTIAVEGREFVLCHFPISEWENEKYGSIHLHGHSHGKPHENPKPNRFDVGVDVYGGPVEVTGDLRYLKNVAGW